MSTAAPHLLAPSAVRCLTILGAATALADAEAAFESQVAAHGPGTTPLVDTQAAWAAVCNAAANLVIDVQASLRASDRNLDEIALAEAVLVTYPYLFDERAAG